jgi:hypothetical protein
MLTTTNVRAIPRAASVTNRDFAGCSSHQLLIAALSSASGLRPLLGDNVAATMQAKRMTDTIRMPTLKGGNHAALGAKAETAKRTRATT